VSENRELTETFGPKGRQVTGEWRKLHNKEFRTNMIIMIKSRRLGRTRYVERMGDVRDVS
jgi:hypothetical protein